MKIWVDGSVFENTRQWGIWRVFYEIMSRTSREVDYTLWLRAEPKQPLPPGVRIYRDDGRIECPRWNVGQRFRRRMSNHREPAALSQADLFHPTGFTLPGLTDTRSIMTVYDMIAESHFAIGIRELEDSIEIKRQAYEQASVLPCISESTASELIAYYPQWESKTTVVTLGAEHLLNDQPSKEMSSNTPLGDALYVGNRSGYKNFMCLLNSLLTKTWPNHVNLSVVGPPFSRAEIAWIARHGLCKRIQHLGVLSTTELQRAYRTARCLVFPSLQEGFGLPCLEAQSLRCPLVCSDIPVFHEVAGRAALFFDPRLSEHLAERVSRVGDPTIRKKLLADGDENLRRFSWDKSGRNMLELYQKAMTRH